jgi:hypothetical protein
VSGRAAQERDVAHGRPIPGLLSAELSTTVARWRADDAACAPEAMSINVR